MLITFGIVIFPILAVTLNSDLVFDIKNSLDHPIKKGYPMKN